MRTIKIENEELSDALADLNIIRLRFCYHDNWMLFPVVVSNNNFVEVLTKKGLKNYFETRKGKVVMKFQKKELEIILTGKVINKDIQRGIYRISIDSAMKYHNSDYFQRFDVRFRASILADDGVLFSGTVENISKGGATVVTTMDVDLAGDFNIKIFLENNTFFEAQTKVLRKKCIEDNNFEYGLKFTNLKNSDKKKLVMKICEMESKFKFINHEYRVVHMKEFEKPVALLTYEIEKSKYIENALVKVGTRNNYLVSSYGALKASIFEENPHLIIIDGITAEKEIIYSAISKLRKNFQALNIIAVIPFENNNIINDFEEGKNATNEEFKSNIHIVYYPLLKGELEELIIKYI
jgi:hypothetical protein